MKYLIKVTQEDIDKGKPRKYCYCPVALAIKRIFLDKSISVYRTYFWINSKSYYLPLIAREFIHNFDMENLVHPFEFELEID